MIYNIYTLLKDKKMIKSNSLWLFWCGFEVKKFDANFQGLLSACKAAQPPFDIHNSPWSSGYLLKLTRGGTISLPFLAVYIEISRRGISDLHRQRPNRVPIYTLVEWSGAMCGELFAQKNPNGLTRVRTQDPSARSPTH